MEAYEHCHKMRTNVRSHNNIFLTSKPSLLAIAVKHGRLICKFLLYHDCAHPLAKNNCTFASESHTLPTLLIMPALQ